MLGFMFKISHLSLKAIPICESVELIAVTKLVLFAFPLTFLFEA